jgi:hypothetical protein
MADQESCSFCTRLPVLRGRAAGEPSHCPLCKGELAVDRNSGAVFRVTVPVARGGSGRSAAWVIATAPAVLVALGICYLVVRGLTGGERPREVAQPAAPKLPLARAKVLAPAPAPVMTPPAAEQPVALVVAERPRPLPAARPPAAKLTVAAARPVVPAAPSRPPEPPYRPQLPSDLDLAEADLAKLLRDVPEIALDADRNAAPDAKTAQTHIEQLVKDIRAQIQKDADGFVKDLENKRTDLAGLPLARGKDCRLDGNQALMLRELSLGIRAALAGATEGRSRRRLDHSEMQLPYDFWYEVMSLPTVPEQHRDLALRIFDQVLQSEPAALRVTWIEKLALFKRKAASVLLAKRALFDLDRKVRETALLALKERPAAEYSEVLLDGLRHPWAPAAAHAAEAVARLGVTDLRPRLSALLDSPDPGEPFVRKIDGKEVPVVREMVRVNHLHNCLLCHAPAAELKKDERGRARRGSRNEPVGPIPVPNRTWPPPGIFYYEEDDGFPLVRADVTYLRQDFSMLQVVDNPGYWPREQRFDFVVRTRPLTEAERTAWEKKRAQEGRRPPSLHRRALLFALDELSRPELAARADGGRFAPWVAVQPGSGNVWRSPCLK